jgi:cytochrome c oxidase subunit 3
MNLDIYQAHPYHLVSPSPWPIATCSNLLSLTVSSALTFHYFKDLYIIVFLSVIMVMYSMALWFRDVISEATYKGNHTLAVQKGINFGIILFIISEVFFFLAIFWAFFHGAISPDTEIGAQWPPLGIQAINPFELPLLNTIILLSSGVTVTQGHHSLIEGDRRKTLNGLLYTIILAIIFTICQGIEYSVSSFTISDGVFGTTFYFATGFHGLHVIIGTIFLATGLWRVMAYHLTDNHHLGLESGILYWHFVDIVWLFLYVFMYYWGS